MTTLCVTTAAQGSSDAAPGCLTSITQQGPAHRVHRTDANRITVDVAEGSRIVITDVVYSTNDCDRPLNVVLDAVRASDDWPELALEISLTGPGTPPNGDVARLDTNQTSGSTAPITLQPGETASVAIAATSGTRGGDATIHWTLGAW